MKGGEIMESIFYLTLIMAMLFISIAISKLYKYVKAMKEETDKKE